ncbi:MAG TPA: hypothetical protein VJ922_08840 [Actinomycetota bacterium]|nr:hypothetical protein [Actinomycetota bacterium]
MNLRTLRSVGASALLSLIIITSASAGSPLLHERFDGSFDETWFFLNFEDDDGVFGKHPMVQCGVDACASFEQTGDDRFLRVSVNPSATEGIYTNTDVSEVELGLLTSTGSGDWNPVPGRPVVLEARVRWNEAYNADGSGAAVGTSGIIMWNSAVGPDGPTPDYDQIGFTWVTDRAFLGLLAGLNATTVIDFVPLLVSRPLLPVNINDWVDLKLVWSTTVLGIQTVQYYVDGGLIGIHLLPKALRNLSVEIWNDNQEPTITLGSVLDDPGRISYPTKYPSPAAQQSFEVDGISVRLGG